MKKFYKFLDKVGAALLGLFFATFIVWFSCAVIYALFSTGLIVAIASYFAAVAGMFGVLGLCAWFCQEFYGDANLAMFPFSIFLFIMSAM